jgi:hypothetical protein
VAVLHRAHTSGFCSALSNPGSGKWCSKSACQTYRQLLIALWSYVTPGPLQTPRRYEGFVVQSPRGLARLAGARLF